METLGKRAEFVNSAAGRNGSRMNVSKAEPSSGSYPASVLIRRLVVDEALAHWPSYAIAIVLMCIAAAAMALSAYLIGTMTNEAYINHNFHGIVVVGIIVMAVFTTKGIATYGGTVMLSYVGNRIVADNQRRMFDKLLR